MPRWDYDFGALMSTGVQIDPEQERIVSEGGLLLTLWPLLMYADRYPRGKPEQWLDQDDQPIMVPVIFDAKPWSVEALSYLTEYSSPDMSASYLTWPSYIGEYVQPDFISTYIDLPVDDHVVRVWNGFPVDRQDRSVQELQRAVDEMFDKGGITEQMLYYMALADGEWWPDLPGDPPQERPADAFEEFGEYQGVFDDLLQRGLVDRDGRIMPLRTTPVERYVNDPQIAKVWEQLLISSRFDWQRTMQVMSQDNHPLLYLEEYFSPWA